MDPQTFCFEIINTIGYVALQLVWNIFRGKTSTSNEQHLLTMSQCSWNILYFNFDKSIKCLTCCRTSHCIRQMCTAIATHSDDCNKGMVIPLIASHTSLVRAFHIWLFFFFFFNEWISKTDYSIEMIVACVKWSTLRT